MNIQCVKILESPEPVGNIRFNLYEVRINGKLQGKVRAAIDTCEHGNRLIGFTVEGLDYKSSPLRMRPFEPALLAMGVRFLRMPRSNTADERILYASSS